MPFLCLKHTYRNEARNTENIVIVRAICPYSLNSAILWAIPSCESGDMPIYAKLPISTARKISLAHDSNPIRILIIFFSNPHHFDASVALWCATLTKRRELLYNKAGAPALFVEVHGVLPRTGGQEQLSPLLIRPASLGMYQRPTYHMLVCQSIPAQSYFQLWAFLWVTRIQRKIVWNVT